MSKRTLICFIFSFMYIIFGFLGIHQLWQQKIIGIIYFPITFNALNLLATKNYSSHFLATILFLLLISLIIYDIYNLWNYSQKEKKSFFKSILFIFLGLFIAFIFSALSIWITTDLGLVPVRFN
jgi:hypothetical protein